MANMMIEITGQAFENILKRTPGARRLVENLDAYDTPARCRGTKRVSIVTKDGEIIATKLVPPGGPGFMERALPHTLKEGESQAEFTARVREIGFTKAYAEISHD